MEKERERERAEERHRKKRTGRRPSRSNSCPSLPSFIYDGDDRPLVSFLLVSFLFPSL